MLKRYLHHTTIMIGSNSLLSIVPLHPRMCQLQLHESGIIASSLMTTKAIYVFTFNAQTASTRLEQPFLEDSKYPPVDETVANLSRYFHFCCDTKPVNQNIFRVQRHTYFQNTFQMVLRLIICYFKDKTKRDSNKLLTPEINIMLEN